MSDDFETVVKLSEKDIEIMGHVFVRYFLDYPSEGPEVSPQSALWGRIMTERQNQIVQARAEGKL